MNHFVNKWDCTMKNKQTILEERRFEDIDTWMSTGQGTNMPEVLQGIFFMDGNPFPEDCVTLNSTWNAETRTLKFPTFGPLQWTFHASEEGRNLYNRIKSRHGVIKIRFQDNTLRRAFVIPKFFGIPFPRWLMEWTMIQTPDSVNGETWLRRNTIFFRLISRGGYTLRKIVDHKGQKTPAFNKMLTQVQETCLVAVEAD